jgi:hypothetical protein
MADTLWEVVGETSDNGTGPVAVDPQRSVGAVHAVGPTGPPGRGAAAVELCPTDKQGELHWNCEMDGAPLRSPLKRERKERERRALLSLSSPSLFSLF